MKPGVWILLIAPLAAAQSSPSWCVAEKTTQAALQGAIDECAAKGGGVAYVPPGNYETGPLWLKDNVELRVEAGATISISPRKEDWSTGAPALVNAKGAKNIAITGRGTIDGKAQYEYVPARRLDAEIAAEMENARRAGVEMKRYYRTGVQKYLVVLQDSSDIRMEGVRLMNAPLWTVRLQNCDRVWMRGLYVYSDLEKGVNADGIDIVSTSNVVLSDSIIVTADDAVCLKTGGMDSRSVGPFRPTENILVTNCVLASSSTPMMIGTETEADIRHVVFSNLVVRDSNKVFGINVQDGATVSDVRFQNVTFELNRRHWNWWGSAEVFKFVLKKRTPGSRLGRIENITIDGAQGMARGTSLISGHADGWLSNVSISNVQIKMLPENKPDKRATHGLVIERVKGLTLRNIQVDWDREAAEPAWGSAVVLRDVEGLVMEGIRGQAGRRDGRVPAVVRERVTEAANQ